MRATPHVCTIGQRERNSPRATANSTAQHLHRYHSTFIPARRSSPSHNYVRICRSYIQVNLTRLIVSKWGRQIRGIYSATRPRPHRPFCTCMCNFCELRDANVTAARCERRHMPEAGKQASVRKPFCALPFFVFFILSTLFLTDQNASNEKTSTQSPLRTRMPSNRNLSPRWLPFRARATRPSAPRSQRPYP